VPYATSDRVVGSQPRRADQIARECTCSTAPIDVRDWQSAAWAGPRDVSYTSDLTPHEENGLGSSTEQQFIDAFPNGRHQGHGREILPSMPWSACKNVIDADLKALFGYLRSLPPNTNNVPDPVIAPVK
jgi:hypothetical protein